MRAARAAAEMAGHEGEIPIGAVVVENAEIIATGRNCSICENDPSGHAEIVEDSVASRVFNHRFEINGGVLADESSALADPVRMRRFSHHCSHRRINC